MIYELIKLNHWRGSQIVLETSEDIKDLISKATDLNKRLNKFPILYPSPESKEQGVKFANKSFIKKIKRTLKDGTVYFTHKLILPIEQTSYHYLRTKSNE